MVAPFARGRWDDKFQIILLLLFALSTIINSAHCVQVKYRVDKEWVQIWINKDGSVDMLYNITITYTSGVPEGIITLGMPKKDFQIHYVRDEGGENLHYLTISSGRGFYGVDIVLRGPIILNKPYTIIVYASVREMLYDDEINPGNVGLKFYPSTFNNAEGNVGSVRVAVVLPEGVAEGEVKYLAERVFSNVYRNRENLLVVYWEEESWPPDREFWIGVSFPKKYINTGPDIWFNIWVSISIIAFISAVCITVILILRGLRKARYERPRIFIEALGPARGLTAVEAAVVLNLEPIRILTMILFSLLLKRVVEVVSTEPIVRLKRLYYGSSEEPNLRYYEIGFLWAIRSDGSLDERALARLYLNLKDTVNLKIRGFSRIDTENYYREIVNRAWQQVVQAGTPELKCNALEENIEWLLVDERFEERLRIAFPPDIIIYPRPGWWYWGWPRGQPPTRTSSGEVKPTPIPGQEFANNIVLAIQKFANNIVLNVQELANQLVPVQKVRPAQRPLRYPSCVCACASCACACACVSCACACAHGGAR